jgi:hypothetical protein
MVGRTHKPVLWLAALLSLSALALAIGCEREDDGHDDDWGEHGWCHRDGGSGGSAGDSGGLGDAGRIVAETGVADRQTSSDAPAVNDVEIADGGLTCLQTVDGGCSDGGVTDAAGAPSDAGTSSD